MGVEAAWFLGEHLVVNQGVGSFNISGRAAFLGSVPETSFAGYTGGAPSIRKVQRPIDCLKARLFA